MEIHYCWRCETEVPFLDELEWSEIDPLISKQAELIKQYRHENNCNIATAVQNALKPATQKYFQLTGFNETNYEAILHHRLSIYGKPCSGCGHLLRTKTAKHCANCGLE